MNRYYRPSAPRYTSQFVEQQYPLDLIAQAGAMKYQNKQKMAADIAQFSALNNVLPAGYRTQEIAPYVRQKWDNRINETINKYSNNYDSPQALMEFTKLKQEWQRDPDVQLMKNDYEFGNKEWDEVKKSPTFALDKKGDNIDPKTGMLKQFQPGSRYQGYSPITRYAAWDEKAINEYKTIEPQKASAPLREEAYTDPYGRPGVRKIQTDYEVRDQNMINEKTTSMAQNVVNRSTPEGAYLYEELREKLGRVPTIEDAIKVYEPYANSAAVMNQQSRTVTDVIDTTGGSGSGAATFNNSGNIKIQLPISPRPSDANMPSRKEINQSRLDKLVNNPAGAPADIKMLDRRLAKADPHYASLQWNDRIKKMKEVEKDTRKQTYDLTLSYWGPEAEKYFNTVVGGAINDKGELTTDGSKVMIEGQTIYDVTNGKILQDIKEKDAITNKGNILRMLGKSTKEDKAYQPIPGLVYFENVKGNKSNVYGMQMPDLVQADKPLWNLYSPQRNHMTGVGNVYAVDYIPGRNLVFSDVSDSGTNGDQENVSAKSKDGKYFVPFYDMSNTGEVDLVVRVFDKNPAKLNIDYTDPDDKSYIKEYKLSDYSYTEDEQGNVITPEQSLQETMYGETFNIK